MRLLAPAKINLTLEVLRRRPDGYHEVRTVLHTIGLADTLEVALADGLQVACDVPDLAGEANLVWQAAALLAAAAGVAPGANVRIAKGIPIAMGLGGGSSDAAAVLLALNQLWRLNWPRERLAEIAGRLGSDVAFFLWGGAALAQGRGEIITPLPPLPPTPLLLVCPTATLPRKTARLYGALTPAHYTDGSYTAKLVENLQAGRDVTSSLVWNCFEAAAFREFPQLAEVWERLAGLTAAPFRLSGAGPALFCLPATKAEFRRVAAALPPQLAQVHFLHTTEGLHSLAKPVHPNPNLSFNEKT